MQYIIQMLLNVIIDSLSGFVENFGTGVMNLLTMDIGEEGSLLDIALTGIADFAQIFQIMAFTILALNFLWQITRIMVSPDGGGESPLALVTSTAVALFFTAYSTTIIRIVQDLFSQFYDFMLTVQIQGTDDAPLGTGFSTIVGTMKYYSSSGSLDVDTTQNVGLGGLLLVLIFSLILAKEFVMYLVEVVERYVLLGILYYTSPLAVSMAGSKSTRHVFSSWVRMVGSQMFLMICNIFFFRLFLLGLNNFRSAVGKIGEAYPEVASAPTSICIVYILVLYGILHIGTRIDSYLGTLGLSAAQTGRGMASSLVAAGLGLRRDFALAKGIGKGAFHIGKKAMNSKTGQEFRGEVRKHRKYGSERVERTADGSGFTTQSAMNLMNRKLTKEDSYLMQSREGHHAFFNGMQGAPPGMKENTDVNSFRYNVGDGTASGTMHIPAKDGKPGASAELMFGPAERMKEKFAEEGRDMSGSKVIPFNMKNEAGRVEPFVAVVTGIKDANGKGTAEARQTVAHAMAANPEMDRKMEEFASKQNCSYEKNAPGIWTQIERDENGNITRATQYADASLYADDAALDSHRETTGNRDYWISDTTPMVQGITKMDAPIDTSVDAKEAIQHIQQSFPLLRDQSLSDVDTSAARETLGDVGAFTFKIGDKTHVCAPAAYVLPTAGTEVTISTCTNGAKYVDAVMPEGATIDQVLECREGTVYAPPIVNHAAATASPFGGQDSMYRFVQPREKNDFFPHVSAPTDGNRIIFGAEQKKKKSK